MQKTVAANGDITVEVGEGGDRLQVVHRASDHTILGIYIAEAIGRMRIIIEERRQQEKTAMNDRPHRRPKQLEQTEFQM